jgi:hypothetical protein
MQAAHGLAAPDAESLAMSDAEGLAEHDAIVMARTLLPTAPPPAVEHDVPVVDVQR